jgi:hypothetical protein
VGLPLKGEKISYLIIFSFFLMKRNFYTISIFLPQWGDVSEADRGVYKIAYYPSNIPVLRASSPKIFNSR